MSSIPTYEQPEWDFEKTDLKVTVCLGGKAKFFEIKDFMSKVYESKTARVQKRLADPNDSLHESNKDCPELIELGKALNNSHAFLNRVTRQLAREVVDQFMIPLEPAHHQKDLQTDEDLFTFYVTEKEFVNECKELLSQTKTE